MSNIRPSLRSVAVLILIGAWAVVGTLTAGPADAHASLEGGSVADGQVLDVAPEEIFLDFNESVQSPRGGLRVYDDRGERVDVGGTFITGDATDLVHVGLQDGLAEGTYAVTYRVTSADGHPINGAFLFSVGREAGAGDALLGQVFSSDADRPYAVAAAVSRWLVYAGTLLASGAVIAAAWLRRILVGDGMSARRLVRLAAATTLVVSVVGLGLQAILVSGDGLAALVDGPGLAATTTSFVGVSAIVRILGAALVLLAVGRPAVRGLAVGRPSVDATPASGGGLGGWLALTGSTMMLGSFLLDGHTLTTGPGAVVWTAGVAHILSAAVWSGGLAIMAIELRARRRADDPVEAGRLVARFSTLFTASVVAVVLAGSALSWVEVRALRALTSTTYGWVLIGKLVVVAPLLLIGLYNNRRLVPALTARRRRAARETSQPAIAGGSDEVADRASARDLAWARLQRSVRLELALVAGVLAATAVLVALQPAAEAAGITGAFSTNQQFEGLGQLSITVDPNRTGRNEIHIYLLSDVGRPMDAAEEVTMQLSQPGLDIGPLIRAPVLAGRGHYILSGPELSVPGRWVITTEVALNQFDVVSTTTEVTVNP